MARTRTISHYCEVDVSEVLDELSNDDLIQECRDREIDISCLLPKQGGAKLNDAVDQAAHEIDTWLHDLRAAFLARDAVHFDVLLVRGEERYLFVEQIATRRVMA